MARKSRISDARHRITGRITGRAATGPPQGRRWITGRAGPQDCLGSATGHGRAWPYIGAAKKAGHSKHEPRPIRAAGPPMDHHRAAAGPPIVPSSSCGTTRTTENLGPPIDRATYRAIGRGSTDRKTAVSRGTRPSCPAPPNGGNARLCVSA